MLDRSYREAYEEMFREVASSMPEEAYYESALLSYIHANRLMSWLFWKRIEAALTMAGDLQDKQVLDFGCGPGVTFRYFKEKNCRITACDRQFSHLAAETCRRFGIDAEIYRDLSGIGGRNFDTIFVLDVLEHAEDPGSIIDALTMLSHDKTLLVLSGPTENLFYRIGRALSGFSGHTHVRNIYDIERIMRAKGLQNRKLKALYYPFPLFRVSTWTR